MRFLRTLARRFVGWVFVLYVEALARRYMRRTGRYYSNCIVEALRRMLEQGGSVVIVNSVSLPGALGHAGHTPQIYYVRRGEVPPVTVQAFDPGARRQHGLAAGLDAAAFAGEWIDLRIDEHGRQASEDSTAHAFS